MALEKKDARRLTKIIKKEAKTEAQAVQTSIKELERLCVLQKEAAAAERKSQLRLTKWTTKEHKARMRFLKEKERYERIEGELRNAENDFEERRDHAAGLTAQVAEKVSRAAAKASHRDADQFLPSRHKILMIYELRKQRMTVNEKSRFWPSRTPPIVNCNSYVRQSLASKSVSNG